jgi:hypothetical protein
MHLSAYTINTMQDGMAKVAKLQEVSEEVAKGEKATACHVLCAQSG